jgi:hypothetical protein
MLLSNSRIPDSLLGFGAESLLLSGQIRGKAISLIFQRFWNLRHSGYERRTRTFGRDSCRVPKLMCVPDTLLGLCRYPRAGC